MAETQTLYSILITNNTNHETKLAPESFWAPADVQTSTTKLALRETTKLMTNNPDADIKISQNDNSKTITLSDKDTISFTIVETKVAAPKESTNTKAKKWFNYKK